MPESESAKLVVIVVMVMFIIAVMLVMVIMVIRTDSIPRTNRMDRSGQTGLSRKLVPAVFAILAMFYTWYGMDYSLNLGTEREQLRN